MRNIRLINIEKLLLVTSGFRIADMQRASPTDNDKMFPVLERTSQQKHHLSSFLS